LPTIATANLPLLLR